MSKRVVVLTTAALLTGASAAAAQACLGLPTRDGAVAVAASYTVNGSDALGGEFHADVTGPAAFGFAYRSDTADDGGSAYELRGAYDFYLIEPAICGVAGLRFEDRSSQSGAERLAVPIGFGIGKELRVDRLAATVYAIPQYMWVREDRSTAGIEETETSNEFTGEAGVTVGLLPLFLNGAITINTLDDDPAFRFRIGLIF